MPARDPNYKPPPPKPSSCWECGAELPLYQAGKCATCANPPVAHNGYGVDLPAGTDAVNEVFERTRKRTS
jgi:hypothetical protein